MSGYDTDRKWECMRKVKLKSTQYTEVSIKDLADTVMELSDMDFAELFLEMGNNYNKKSRGEKDCIARHMSPSHGGNRKYWLFDLVKSINHFEFLSERSE